MNDNIRHNFQSDESNTKIDNESNEQLENIDDRIEHRNVDVKPIDIKTQLETVIDDNRKSENGTIFHCKNVGEKRKQL